MTNQNSYASGPYLIVETAYIHEGDISYLYKMVDEIMEIKPNAIKFHLLLDPEAYMQKKHPLMTELRKWNFSEKQWDEILKYTLSKNLDVIALCDDVESIKYINKKNNITGIEIHATSLNDWFMLKEVTNFKGTIFLGVGASTLDEIQYAVDFLRKNDKTDIVLMYGFQNYPTNYSDINLSKMLKLKELFELPIGYADHAAYDDPNNEIISIMATAMSFNILEKHFTLEPGKERIDYHSAVGKKQMKKIKELMGIALDICGDGGLKLSQSELNCRKIGPMKKALVAKQDIKKGQKLSYDNLWFKRTKEQSTISQNQLLQFIGLEAIVDIKKDEIIDFTKTSYISDKNYKDNFGLIEKENR